MRLFRILEILVKPHPTFTVQQSDPEYFDRKHDCAKTSSQPILNSPSGMYPLRTSKTSTLERRTLKSYRHRRIGTSDEDILNMTCSLDMDSLSLMGDRAIVEVDSSFDNCTSVEYYDAGSMASPGSCYSVTSYQAGTRQFQFVDKNSGVVFDTVSEGNHGRVTAQDIGFASILCDLDCIFAAAFSADSISFSAHLVESLPVLALTVPTPVIPPSPIFVPQSPVTLSKFIAASERVLDEADPLSSLMPVPLVPECEECSEVRRQRQEEFYDDLEGEEASEQQWFCRSCHRQWLACQVWYQACDGGRRQQLREPFIKPGESNASNRALIEMLGIPAVSVSFKDHIDEGEGTLKGLVVEIRDVGDSIGVGTRIRNSVKRKFRRSLKRTLGRFAYGGEDCGEVDEMGQIQYPSRKDGRPLKDMSRRGGVWERVQTILRLRANK